VPLPQVERSTLVDQIIASMEALIRTGEWAVGAKVPPEPELVRSFGVSRNTVREAVRALAHAGLLDPRPGDGTYVRTSTSPDASLQRVVRRASAREVLEVRRMIEREAARTAAERRSEADVHAIEEALEARSRAYLEGALAGFADADLAFHQAVVSATHNRVLVEVYASLTAAIRNSVVEVVGDTHASPAEARVTTGPEHPDHTPAHVALADAIRRRDPLGAENAAAGHLAESIDLLDNREL
jgi:DNA-binding FadR family transcriptional regulator